MEVTRPVVGQIMRPGSGDDSLAVPWARAKVRFTLVPGSFTAAAQYPTGKVTVTTDDDGLFTAHLWPNELGSEASVWECRLPDNDTFTFTLPLGDGSPIALSLLREAGATASDPQYPALLTVLTEVAEDAVAPSIAAAGAATTSANAAAAAALASRWVDRGTYNPATAYVLNDVVEHAGSTYRALVPNTGVAPTGVTDATWQLVARKGFDLTLGASVALSNTIGRMIAGLATTIVCWGDSITYGMQQVTGIQVANPYPATLQAYLRAAYNNNLITVINRGHIGWQTDELLANIAADVTAFSPHAVLINSGINDLRGSGTGGAALTIAQYKTNLAAMVEGCVTLGAEVAVLPPTPIIDTTSDYHRRIASFQGAARDIAAQFRVGFLDWVAEITKRVLGGEEVISDLWPDNVHFADAKYPMLAEIVMGKLLDANATPSVLFVQGDKEMRIPVVASPWVQTNITSVYSDAANPAKKNYLLNQSDTGKYLRMDFYVDRRGVDLFHRSPKNTSLDSAIVVQLDGAAGPTIDFYADGSFLWGVEDLIAENLAPGWHTVEFRAADIEVGRRIYPSEFLFRPSLAGELAEAKYGIQVGATLGTAEHFVSVLKGTLRYQNAAPGGTNQTGVLLTGAPSARLKTGKTLVIEAAGTFVDSTGVTWFGNRNGTGATVGYCPGYLLFFSGNNLQLYRFNAVNVQSGVLGTYTPGTINYAIPHTLRIEQTAAGVITVYLDGVSAFSWDPLGVTYHTAGSLGLFANTSAVAKWELSRFEFCHK